MDIFKKLQYANFVLCVFGIIPLTVYMNKMWVTSIMMSGLFVLYWITSDGMRNFMKLSKESLDLCNQILDGLKIIKKSKKRRKILHK